MQRVIGLQGGMLPRVRILNTLAVFTPRSGRQLVVSFVFWECVFASVYLLLLGVFGHLGTVPVWQHVVLGWLLCAPFLTITLMVISEHLQLSKKFRDLSEVDTLTGLRNRRSFLSLAKSRHDPGGRDLLILLDIDHFKSVNDTYGHQMGDLCLKEVAKFLSGWIRPADVLCRYGGEEFAVFLSNTSLRAALPVAQTVSRGHRFDLGGTRVNITFSMGLAQWEHGQTLDEVLSNADQALYYCKRNGRAQAHAFGLEPPDEGAQLRARA